VVPRSRARTVGVAAGAAGTGRLAFRSGRDRVAAAMMVSVD
jgi:hypothetical protein